MKFNSLLALLVFILAGCGGAMNSDPVGLYQARWRGTWSSTATTDTGIIELRIGRTGTVDGTFQRTVAGLDATLSGSLQPNGDLAADYDSEGGSPGSLNGNLQFDGNINRLKGTLARTEDNENMDIDVAITRR